MKLTLDLAAWRLHLSLGRRADPPPPPPPPAEQPADGDAGSATSEARQTGWHGDPRPFGFTPPDVY